MDQNGTASDGSWDGVERSSRKDKKKQERKKNGMRKSENGLNVIVPDSAQMNDVLVQVKGWNASFQPRYFGSEKKGSQIKIIIQFYMRMME